MSVFEEKLRWLQRHTDRWWYLPLVGALAAADLFVMVIPMEAIIVASVMLLPKRWLRVALVSSAGSSLGALALGAFVSEYGRDWAESHFASSLQSSTWQDVAQFLQRYGEWALGLMAFGPLPQQPAVILVALAGASVTWIFLSVLIGRGVKYTLFAWGATHAPKWFERAFSIESPIEAKAVEEWKRHNRKDDSAP